MAHNIAELPSEQKITPQELKEKLQDSDLFIIDVRNPTEIEGSGTIKTKKNLNIPFPELEAALSLTNELFKGKYGIEKPASDGSGVVFHCMHGGRGSRSVVLAEKLGLKKTKNLDGGFSKWQEGGCD